MKRSLLVCGLLLVAIVIPVVAQEESKEEKALNGDLRKLQGKWEYTFKDNDGKATIRKVKDIKDNTEKVTWYLPNGDIYMVNTVDFKLEMKGEDKIFSYFNGKVVEGANKGEDFQAGSFVYTLEGDSWTETLDNGEKIVWQRVKEKKEKK